MNNTLTMNDALIINGQEITSLPDEEIANFEQPDKYQMIIVDNKLIHNKAIVLKNDYLFSTMEFTENAEFLKLYPKNKLINLEKVELQKKEK